MINLHKIINYVQYSKNPKNVHSMIIKPEKLNKVVKNTKSRNINESLLEVTLVEGSDRSKEEDLSTTYLGKINMTWDKDLMVEQKFPISKSGYTVGTSMDGTECLILLNTGASKSFMSKSYYLWCKALHSSPKVCIKKHREF